MKYSSRHTEGMENTDASTPTGQSAAPGMPRWVKVFAAVVLLLALALIVAVALGSDHGPGRHAGMGPVASVTPSTDGTLVGPVA